MFKKKHKFVGDILIPGGIIMNEFTLNEQFNSSHNLIPDSGIFSCLTGEQREELSSRVTLMTYERQDIIFKQNMPSDHIVYIVSGLVKVFLGGRGKRVVCLKLVGPGNFAALSSAFASNIYMNSASAIEKTLALMIRSETMKEIMKRNGNFSASIIDLMGKDNIDLSYKLVSFSMKQLPGRVADLLRYFSEEVFRSTEFTVPLTRQEMAELIGTTKESLIRTLNEFKNDKIIDLNGKRIIIISKHLIKVLSEIG